MKMPLLAMAVALAACGTRASAPVSSPGTADTTALYDESQVDSPVSPLFRATGPAYPSELRKEGITGEVFVRYVVDTTGRVEVPTIRILRSSHVQFSSSIRSFLVSVRFTPAMLRGQPVRMLVCQPFAFSLHR